MSKLADKSMTTLAIVLVIDLVLILVLEVMEGRIRAARAIKAVLVAILLIGTALAVIYISN